MRKYYITIGIFVVIFLGLWGNTAFGGNFQFQVPFPGAERLENAVADATLLGRYIVAVYQFAVWFSISLSIFMIMLAGFRWMISGGNLNEISIAKNMISNAFIGLVLSLSSFIILQTINPQLVNLHIPGIEKPYLSGPGNKENKAENSYKACCVCLVYFRSLGQIRQCRELGSPNEADKECSAFLRMWDPFDRGRASCRIYTQRCETLQCEDIF